MTINKIRIVNDLCEELGVGSNDGPVFLKSSLSPKRSDSSIFERLSVPYKDNIMLRVNALHV